MTEVHRPGPSDYEAGSGDLEYIMALELYADQLETELTAHDQLIDAITIFTNKVEHEASFDDVLRKHISSSIVDIRAALKEAQEYTSRMPTPEAKR